MEKSKNENRNKWLLAIAFVVFFVVVFKVNGQSGMNILRQDGYDSYVKRPVVTRVPDYCLVLECLNKKDTAYLSILSDSISDNMYGVRLFAYLPKNTDLTKTSVVIKFVDGKESVCLPVLYGEDAGECEYEITQEVYGKLKYVRVDYIKFDNITAYSKIKEDCYFKSFLSICHK